MKARSKLSVCICTLLICTLLLGSAAPASAAGTDSMTVEEAKAYLANYSEVRYDSEGEYVVRYEFETEEALQEAAEYIAENGVEAYHAMADAYVAEQVANEPPAIQPCVITDGETVKYISGDGLHTVTSVFGGRAYYDKAGTVEYSFQITFNVLVENNQILGITSKAMNVLHVGAGGNIIDTSLSQAHTHNQAGVSASFTVSKTIVWDGVSRSNVIYERYYENVNLTAYLR